MSIDEKRLTRILREISVGNLSGARFGIALADALEAEGEGEPKGPRYFMLPHAKLLFRTQEKPHHEYWLGEQLRWHHDSGVPHWTPGDFLLVGYAELTESEARERFPAAFTNQSISVSLGLDKPHEQVVASAWTVLTEAAQARNAMEDTVPSTPAPTFKPGDKVIVDGKDCAHMMHHNEAGVVVRMVEYCCDYNPAVQVSLRGVDHHFQPQNVRLAPPAQEKLRRWEVDGEIVPLKGAGGRYMSIGSVYIKPLTGPTLDEIEAWAEEIVAADGEGTLSGYARCARDLLAFLRGGK
jgi:hypothetical protein